MKLKTIDNINFKGKVVLLRCDLNLPFGDDGEVSDITKIKRHKITINELLSKQARIVVLSHLGRPNGKVVNSLSLNNISEAFANEMQIPEITVMPFCSVDIMKKILKTAENASITFIENIRFYPEEEANDTNFASNLASMADYYINDAFSVSHRKHVSTYGLSKFLPTYLGRSFQLELDMLNKLNKNINKPVMAIIGGSKISTKINLLYNLLNKVDYLVIGGAMANTFLTAKGIKVGKSIIEKNKINVAKTILKKADKTECEIILPEDVTVSKSLKNCDDIKNQSVDLIDDNYSIFDIGEKSLEIISNKMAACKTLFWNGPLGVYEQKPYDNSTNVLGRTAAILTKANIITSVVGGGDTVAALNNAELSGGFSYVSIAGGALIEWLEGKNLPGLEFLK